MTGPDPIKSRNMREAHIVNRYLTILAARRGKRQSVDEIQKRIDQINAALTTDAITWVKRIDLVQERRNLLAMVEDSEDEAETEFVEIIAGWAERRRITYGALREVGVPAEVLRAAGMTGDG